ncbi:MAG: hypothetical protein GWN67_06710, partial [Phycisphaerae bacterium]|nr:hypothetical protein [Phycisphaerae bacterium]NIW92595.1 hypothetical protein [Phycisphaerae bacterium]
KPATVAYLFGHVIFILLSLTAKPPALERLSRRAAEGVISAIINELLFGEDTLLATGTPMSFFKRFKVALYTLIKAQQIVLHGSVFTVSNANLCFAPSVLMMLL